MRSRDKLGRLAGHLIGPALREKLSVSDIIQSTYLQVIRDVSKFDGDDDDAFAAWIGQILENTVKQKHRFFTARKRAAPPDAADEIDRRRRRPPTPSSLAGRMEDIAPGRPGHESSQ